MSIELSDNYLNERLVSIATISAIGLTLAAITLGGCVTAGWLLDKSLLKHMFLDGTVVWSSVGVSTIMYSIALALTLVVSHEELSRKVEITLKVIATALGLIILTGAMLTAVETLGSLDLSLNHIWYRASEDSSGLSFPGPMTPDVSFAFIALSISLFIQNWLPRSRVEIAQWLSALALLVTSLPLIGALSGAESLCTFFGCLRMSPGISILFMLMCGASFLTQAKTGLAGFLCSNTASGLVARRAILLVVFLPLLFALRFAIVHYKIVDIALGWAVFGLGALVLTIALVVTGVRSAEELMASAIKIDPVQLYDQSGLVSASMNANTGLSINLQGLPSASIFTRQPPPLPGDSATGGVGAGAAGGAAGGAAMAAALIGSSAAMAPPAADRIRKVCLACELEFSPENEVCPSCESVLTKMINKSLVGQVFADKYEVTWQLGDGGMASVYLAKHLYINQEVAIKVLHAALSGNIVDIKRFQQEGKALGTLNHPNIVAVRDFGFTAGGEAFLAMEYVKGTSLSDIIEKRKMLNVQETAQIVLQVCEALLHAHGEGIVHRDLKPSNIMCSPRAGGGYDVKVVDFGLAKITGRDELDAIKLTQTGDCQGSPPYMSPEQCTAKPVDFRTDIYALGCILYECMSGKAPFVATSIYETLTMHVNNPPPNFPEWLVVPPAYATMVMQALQKNPNKRQQSVDELRQVLLGLV